jgi:hypothetical protein
MSDHLAELAEELWDLLAAEVEAAQRLPLSLSAKLAAARATLAVWEAIGAAHAGRHKEAAREQYLHPPVTG